MKKKKAGKKPEKVKIKKIKVKKPPQPEWKTKPIGGMIFEAGNSLKYLTGTWKTARPITNYDKCIHCLKCVVYCPENCIKAKNDKKDHTEYQYCKGCGICAQVCPVKCIKMEDEDKFQE
ncbi:MAG: 4Fe-4S binding protein [Nanoarchaeota archaeon]|nr:4Fe-4S binding protein [Nanoarchaeota archaeon]